MPHIAFAFPSRPRQKIRRRKQAFVFCRLLRGRRGRNVPPHPQPPLPFSRKHPKRFRTTGFSNGWTRRKLPRRRTLRLRGRPTVANGFSIPPPRTAPSSSDFSRAPTTTVRDWGKTGRIESGPGRGLGGRKRQRTHGRGRKDGPEGGGLSGWSRGIPAGTGPRLPRRAPSGCLAPRRGRPPGSSGTGCGP